LIVVSQAPDVVVPGGAVVAAKDVLLVCSLDVFDGVEGVDFRAQGSRRRRVVQKYEGLAVIKLKLLFQWCIRRSRFYPDSWSRRRARRRKDCRRIDLLRLCRKFCTRRPTASKAGRAGRSLQFLRCLRRCRSCRQKM
jgi:hypothetical protein